MPCVEPTFARCPRCWTMPPGGETGVTFYSVRGEILSALAWREVRERAQVTARRLIGAGFAAGERILITADTWPGFFDRFFGAQYAGLLPVPVSIPVGIGGKEAYLDQLRRQLAASGAVAAVGVDDLAGFLADAAKQSPAVRLHGGMTAVEVLPEKPVDLRPLGPADLCYIQFSSGSTRHPHGVQITQPALMANLAGMTGPAGLDVVVGRSRRELAAALSRHGPDRLPDGAALEPALDRLSDAARLRAPADAVAEPDLAQSRHHRLQPELRLRPRHPPRRQPGAGRPRPVVLAPCRHRRRHDPARRARPLRRDVQAGGLRPQGLHPELRHGRGLPRHHLLPARHGRAHRHDRPCGPGRQPARGAGRRSPGRAARAALRAVRQGAAGPSPGSARRGRQGAGRP